MPTDVCWDRLEAIELLSDEDRKAFADILARELLRPGAMTKRDAKPPLTFRTPPARTFEPETQPLRTPVRPRNPAARPVAPAIRPERVAPFTTPARSAPVSMPFTHTATDHDRARGRAAEAMD